MDGSVIVVVKWRLSRLNIAETFFSSVQAWQHFDLSSPSHLLTIIHNNADDLVSLRIVIYDCFDFSVSGKEGKEGM